MRWIGLHLNIYNPYIYIYITHVFLHIIPEESFLYHMFAKLLNPISGNLLLGSIEWNMLVGWLIHRNTWCANDWPFWLSTTNITARGNRALLFSWGLKGTVIEETQRTAMTCHGNRILRRMMMMMSFDVSFWDLRTVMSSPVIPVRSAS